MTPQEIKANAIAFLGHMLTKPEVMSDLQKVPEPGPGPGKDADGVAAVIAKHLGIAPPTRDELRAMAGHIQEATSKVKDALTEHAPAQATTFSPSHFIMFDSGS